MRNPSPVGIRLHLLIYSRRSNWHCFSQLIPRHYTPRYILCSSPLPLCSLNRRCICNCRRLCPLIPPIFRLHTPQHVNKNPLRSHVCRSKPHFLPTAFPWARRNTSSILRLPGRLHPLKHNFLHWLNNFSCSSNYILIYYLRSFCCQTRGLVS